MSATKRPQNKCKSCSYTWYPRGKSLSLKCPSCGSSQVTIVGSWWWLAGLAFLLYVFVVQGDKKPKDAAPPVPVDSVPSTSLDERGSPPVRAPEPAAPVEKPSAAEPIEQRLPSSPAVEAPASATQADTPTSLCAHESNIFSRNNCEWKECEKPEFSALSECANKKPKSNGVEG